MRLLLFSLLAISTATTARGNSMRQLAPQTESPPCGDTGQPCCTQTCGGECSLKCKGANICDADQMCVACGLFSGQLCCEGGLCEEKKGLLCNPITKACESNVKLNEFEPNPPGTNPIEVDIELKWYPGYNFQGCLIQIDCDENQDNSLDLVSNIGGTFGENGLLRTKVLDAENPSLALILLEGLCGSIDPSCDWGSVGIENCFDLSRVLDAIVVVDGDVGTESFVGDESCLVRTDITHTVMPYAGGEPKLAFRDGDRDYWYVVATTTNVISDANGNVIQAGEFDVDPISTTFGSQNPSKLP